MNEFGPRSIVIQMEPRVRLWFSRRVMNTDDVEDLTQDCMCAIIEGYPRLQRRSSPEAWVYGICRNLWFRHQRKRANMPSTLVKEPGDERCIDPDARLDLRLAMDALPERLRVVYELYHRRGMPIKDVAAFLERPSGTVKYQLHEIRSLLRRRLA